MTCRLQRHGKNVVYMTWPKGQATPSDYGYVWSEVNTLSPTPVRYDAEYGVWVPCDEKELERIRLAAALMDWTGATAMRNFWRKMKQQGPKIAMGVGTVLLIIVFSLMWWRNS